MAFSGIYVGLLLLGALPIMLFGTTAGSALGTLGIVLLVWLLLGVIDWLLATPARRISITRELPERVRLGETVSSTLLLTNLAGRTLNAQVRDAWEPSAGAPRMRERVRIPAGERRAVTTVLKPWRRGDRRSEVVVVRSWGPLRLVARQATLKSACRLARPAPARAGWADDPAGARAGHRVRFAARVRARRRRALDRLAGDRAAAGARCAHLAA
jgi:hypothetical protein